MLSGTATAPILVTANNAATNSGPCGNNRPALMVNSLAVHRHARRDDPLDAAA